MSSSIENAIAKEKWAYIRFETAVREVAETMESLHIPADFVSKQLKIRIDAILGACND